jgi:hypothetical protein
MRGAISPLTQYTFMAWCLVAKSTGLNIHLIFLEGYLHVYIQELYKFTLLIKRFRTRINFFFRENVHIGQSYVVAILVLVKKWFQVIMLG